MQWRRIVGSLTPWCRFPFSAFPQVLVHWGKSGSISKQVKLEKTLGKGRQYTSLNRYTYFEQGNNQNKIKYDTSAIP